jgi:hypothetical protein
MLLPFDLPPGGIAQLNFTWRVNPLDAAKDNI